MRNLRVTGSWALPHDDAAGFLAGCIDAVFEAFSDDPEERPSEGTDDFESYLAFGSRAERHDPEDDAALFPVGPVSERYEFLNSWQERFAHYLSTLPKLRELASIASDAILAGDSVEAYEALDTLISAADVKIELPPVENWSSLLADLSAREHASDASKEDVRSKVAVAINRLCVELCRLVACDRFALERIEWRQLERVVATALDGIGFDVMLTAASKDGGKDVVATWRTAGHRYTYYVEIKHSRSGKRVGSGLVYDFIEVNTRDHTDGGLFLSTSGFGPHTLSQLSEICTSTVCLGEETKVVSLCQHFVRRGNGLWKSSSDLSTILFQDTM